jgi:hypothetical protein
VQLVGKYNHTAFVIFGHAVLCGVFLVEIVEWNRLDMVVNEERRDEFLESTLGRVAIGDVENVPYVAHAPQQQHRSRVGRLDAYNVLMYFREGGRV